MGQVTIYLDDETERKMRAAAEARNLSKSKWIAELIRRTLRSEWPPSIHSLAGAWPDFPTAEEIRRGNAGDVEREPL